MVLGFASFVQNSQTVLFELGIVIIVAALFGYISRILKQPLIPAYLLSGILLSPLVFGVIKNTELIRNLAEIGIIFLLFLIGLEMDIGKLKSVGRATLITGLFQIVLTFIFGYWLALQIGLGAKDATYAGIILASSSTMIVLKLLVDENKLHTLHGRIVLGILFVQDIFVILAMGLLLGNTSLNPASALIKVGTFLILIVTAYLINRFIASKIFHFAAKSGELLLILSLAVCFLFALLASALGYSVAIGAFLGGITIGNLPYTTNLIGRIGSLKDFFSTIFFVGLGLQLPTISFSSLVQPFFLFLLAIIIFKPFIIMLFLAILGYDKRNAFASGILLGQVSEFGLILALSASDMSPTLFSLTILLGIISIGLTSYIAKYELWIYNHLNFLLTPLDKLAKKKKILGYDHHTQKTVVLFGCNRMGGTLLASLRSLKNDLIIVDFNPDVIVRLQKEKISCVYGDMTNTEVLKNINPRNLRLIISTVPSRQDSLALLKQLKTFRSKALVFVTAETLDDAIALYSACADYVIVPHIMSGEHIGHILNKYVNDPEGLRKVRKEQMRKIVEMHSEHW